MPTWPKQHQAPGRGAGQHELRLEAGAAAGRLGAGELVAQRLAARAVRARERGGQGSLL